MKAKLPVDPADLIEVAVGDFSQAVRRPDVAVEMSTWLAKVPHSTTCTVCLAGAVMLERFKPQFSERRAQVSPSDILAQGLGGSYDAQAMDALNQFRIGDLVNGLFCLTRWPDDGTDETIEKLADAWLAAGSVSAAATWLEAHDYLHDPYAFLQSLQTLANGWRLLPEEGRAAFAAAVRAAYPDEF